MLAGTPTWADEAVLGVLAAQLVLLGAILGIGGYTYDKLHEHSRQPTRPT